MSRWDCLVVLAALSLLFAVALPLLGTSRTVSNHLVCSNNLRIIGRAARSWALDHQDKFNWMVPYDQGGSFGKTRVPEHFQPLSRFLVDPRVLACPAGNEIPGSNFQALKQSNCSYFLAPHSEPDRNEEFLVGDPNVSGASSSTCSIVGKTDVMSIIGTPYAAATIFASWSSDYHNSLGHVGLADGSVRLTASLELKTMLSRIMPASGAAAVHLLRSY